MTKDTDYGYGTWNIRSLYRAGSVMTVLRELSKCKLDFVAVQDVKWDGGGSEPANAYTFFNGKGSEKHKLGNSYKFLCALSNKRLEM
jgi:hypothetical protein